MVTHLPLTTTAWVQVLTLEAWWRWGNTFASHCCPLGLSPGYCRLGGTVVTHSPLTAAAWVWVLTLEAWWHRGNTFTCHHYGLGLTQTPGCMWGVFYPLQPMPGGFPLDFLPPWGGLKLFRLELSHKANWPGKNFFWLCKINGFTFTIYFGQIFHGGGQPRWFRPKMSSNLANRCHYMGLYNEVECMLWSQHTPIAQNHWQTDTTENIIFPKFHW